VAERDPRVLAGATVGIITAGAAIGIAHLAAGLIDPQVTPIVAVGQAGIDLTPEWLKSFAIETFGANDKLVLLLGIGVVLVAASIVLGIVALRRVEGGIAGLGVFTALGLAAALSRPAATWAHAIPVLAGGAAGVVVLVRLRDAAMGSSERRQDAAEADGAGMDRRRFFLTAMGGVAVAASSGGIGAVLARRSAADGSRAAIRLPAPASPASAATAAELSVPGLSPFFTPNSRFYRVDTALLVPSISAEDWRLRIHGMVERELTLDYEGLLDRPLIERDITLSCVSNPVGGRYVGNARWVGAPLRDLLEEVGVAVGADQIVTRSVDGFTIGTPTDVAMDGRDAMLAVAMNGEPLPLAHGFPVRMIVPGLYGYVSATKWLVDMELTTFEAFDPYWIERGWADRGPIKTMARIDTPTSFLEVPAGVVPVAGVAWAQHTGIDRVEVQVDDLPWADAELAGEDSIDTWRQWVHRWAAPPGQHRVRARATDRSGVTQPERRRDPFPDGATGWHEIVVDVS
jgi:DMSO/TMAO reductase YedYZ molybdopterin-dependent catalytic subunit